MTFDEWLDGHLAKIGWTRATLSPIDIKNMRFAWDAALECLKSGTDLRTRVKQLNDAVWFLGLDDAIKIVTPYNSRGELVLHVLETADGRSKVPKPEPSVEHSCVCPCTDPENCNERRAWEEEAHHYHCRKLWGDAPHSEERS